ncbi:MAG: hypothetical protein IJV28_00700 [Paludibacteraceae bacterium]|nr:hypothetical protein [Paludibacteraceae bacterium]
MNKILRALNLVPLSFLLTGCWTSIFTVAPTVEPVAPVKTVYTTTVTTPTPKHTTVTTVTVNNYNSDPCFYLDLNAVAAAFAESRSVKEFEELLNSSRYMINNLDLNGDGWIDYLRVIETHSGYYHTLLIQACVAPGMFQDVATLIAERRTDVLYVEVVGDRYLYGYNYIVRPVFVKRPPMWDVYGRATYAVWSSPYYYDYYPSYYTRPRPIYLNHYQAYVTTYMTNHHYCHRCEYPTTVFYTNYTSMTQGASRNDYATRNPSGSFEQRVTRSASSTNGVSVRNAGQLRTEVAKTAAKEEQKSTTTSTRTSASTSTATTGKSATSTGGTSARSTSSSSATSTSRTPASTSSTPKTDRTTTASTSSRSTSTTAASSSTATRSTTSTGGTSARSTSTGSATATKKTASTGTSTTQRQPSTTIETRVNKSGTTRTTVRTTDATGRTTTVRRESSSNTRSSGRTSTSTRSSSGSTRTSSSTGGTSTRSR